MDPRAKKFLNQYKRIDVEMSVQGATPHQLVQMLYEGALKNLAMAKGSMERKEYAKKGELISKTIAIVSALRSGLDRDMSTGLTDNLDRLYDYMNRRLFQANAKNDTSIVDEVAGLLRDLKEAWEQIPPQFRNATQEQLNHAKNRAKSSKPSA